MKVGVNMDYRVSDMLNISELKDLMESIYNMTGIACVIKDVKGEILNMVSGYNIFDNLESSDCYNNILKQIERGKKVGVYKYSNGLVYIGIPIFVSQKHVGTIFLSPVFLKESHRKSFEKQLKLRNPNKEEYVINIEKIPVTGWGNYKKIIRFFYNSSLILGKIGDRIIEDLHKNKMLNQSYRELSNVYEQLSIAQDELKIQYDKIEKIAYYDQLTGLPNWNFFGEQVESRIEKNPQEGFSIFQIDLDNFKNVNDIFGYEYGDRLLKEIGNTLNSLNMGIVSRTSGNEFLILKDGYEDIESLNNTAQYILNTISGLWNLDGNETLVSVSIGITVYPRHGDKFTTLIRNTDIALNKTKLFGKNSYRLFEKSMYDEILRKAEMEKELRKAIKNNEFILYYQPQVDVKTRKAVSFEALIRWKSPKLGWVMPLEFIGLAEETGLIVPIGEWVLKTACMQNKTWKDKGYIYDFISINVSPIQLKDRNFLNIIKKVLKETELKSQFLEIEITESVMMESLEGNLKVINELKNMGIRVALDDFGSGYSSLNYLKSIPINTLKIDKTFIDGICKDSYKDIITDQIIKLAHRMELEVVAEGVEGEEQIQSLEGKNCNKIQGYYFGKPMPSNHVENFFKKQFII
ncbi:EAL domain-containing protein [Clostridium sp. WILCCON 0269]|uniref:EAL domain-containing protein n=1 Tax=Candidatus Clostridium eludens TaxID=3381663 RepID=A0ABW8SLM3_9CLOT